jgi:hypothetical protein
LSCYILPFFSFLSRATLVISPLSPQLHLGKGIRSITWTSSAGMSVFFPLEPASNAVRVVVKALAWLVDTLGRLVDVPSQFGTTIFVMFGPMLSYLLSLSTMRTSSEALGDGNTDRITTDSQSGQISTKDFQKVCNSAGCYEGF